MDARTVQLITQEALAEKIARTQLELQAAHKQIAEQAEELKTVRAELAEAKKPKTRSRRK